MKSRISLLVFFLAFSSLTFSQPKVEEIKLTGHLQEKVTIIMLGKEQVITTLPYTFNVLQENIPFTIKFVSPNFDYTDIEVPKYTKRDYRNAWISGILLIELMSFPLLKKLRHIILKPKCLNNLLIQSFNKEFSLTLM